MGNANYDRLWNELPKQFLQYGHVGAKRADGGCDVQRVQRYTCSLGVGSHYGTTMRANVAANIFRDQ